MDFGLLEDFLAVVEQGSILAAAEATGTSQPTLSRRIRELEDSLGVLLFNRTTRGVTATVYGTAFAEHARQMLRDRQRALDDLRALKTGTEGHARIGLAPAFAGYLPAAIRSVRASRPGVTFEVIEGTYDALVLKTLKGEIDGAFTMLAPGESDELLAVRPIGREPVVIVAAPAHGLCGSSGLALTDLANESWVLMNRPRSILDAFLQLAGELGLESPEVAVETSSLEFLKAMVSDAAMLAAVPRGAVVNELDSGRLKALDVSGMPEVETAFVHRHGVLPPLVSELVRQVELL